MTFLLGAILPDREIREGHAVALGQFRAVSRSLTRPTMSQSNCPMALRAMRSLGQCSVDEQSTTTRGRRLAIGVME